MTTQQQHNPTTLRDEVRNVDLGDKRLNDRLGKIVDELGANPGLSIPAATSARSEMEAAYRFFDNDNVTPDKILQPHIDATIERISQCNVVLLVQDTTEVDLTRPKQQVRGAGLMDCKSRRGAFLHPMLAFRPDGVPLGTVWQKTWTRETINSDLSKSQRKAQRTKTPIEQKESHRWIEGYRAGREIAAACPDTTCVCVSDSESDIYELFSEPRSVDNASAVHFVVRTGQQRCTETGKCLDDVRKMPCLHRKQIHVSSRVAKVPVTKHKREQSRDAREAEVEIRATTVTMTPPGRFDRKLPAVSLNVVLVEEPAPPEGTEPIRWLLATTLPIDTLEEVQNIVTYYTRRWQIEIFFRTLKSGCRIERRLFEELPRTLNCLAVYSIIAWRVMYLCYLGRECPDLDCEVVFSPSEWKSVYSVVKSRTLPSTPPRLNKLVRMIATLGGFVDRPKNDPGPQTLWTGLQRLHSFSLAWDTFGPETYPQNQDQPNLQPTYVVQ